MSNKIIIAGGSGFIGRALARAIIAGGGDAVILTRSPRSVRAGRGAYWDGRTLGEWTRELDGAAAVINLAGKNVNCRYTKRNLAEIDQSRVDAVTVMGQALAACANPPAVLIQASTTAIYGDAGDRWCDEVAPPGAGIPPATATQWEDAFARSATPPTIRRVLLRISFALGGDGGVLGMLAALARAFLGGRVGSGRQYISWIHIDDLVAVVLRAIEDPTMSGTYNVATPSPVTNAEFMRELRRALHRPWSPPTPAWAVRVGAFLMRTEPVLALTGRRVMPRRLIDAGFTFRYPTLPEALAAIYSSPVPSSSSPAIPPVAA
jgi:uncharacterized protein (TIGR01777 family)